MEDATSLSSSTMSTAARDGRGWGVMHVIVVTPDSIDSKGNPGDFSCAMLGLPSPEKSACDMIESRETIDRTDVCGSCGTSVEGPRYLLPVGLGLRSFCSDICVREAQGEERSRRWKTRRRAMKVAIIGLAVAGACLAPHEGQHIRRPTAAPVVKAAPVPGP